MNNSGVLKLHMYRWDIYVPLGLKGLIGLGLYTTDSQAFLAIPSHFYPFQSIPSHLEPLPSIPNHSEPFEWFGMSFPPLI